jgi:hypothetical protein
MSLLLFLPLLLLSLLLPPLEFVLLLHLRLSSCVNY